MTGFEKPLVFQNKAEKEDNIELVNYYKKEIESMTEDKEEKERLLEKGG